MRKSFQASWMPFVLAVAALLQTVPLKAEAATGDPHSGWNFKDAALIPVQSGGRLKPFDTLAREIMLFQTGSRYYPGWNPVDLMFSFMTSPEVWEKRPFVRVGRDDVKRQLGLDEKRIQFTPEELFKESSLIEYAQRLGNPQQEMSPPPGGAPKKDQRDEELRRTIERLSTFRNIVSGEAWPLIPAAPPQPWKTLAQADGADALEIRQAFARMAIAYQQGDQTLFEKFASETRALVQAKVPEKPENFDTLLNVEYFYNTLHPFLWAWILYLTAGLVWIAAIILDKKQGTPKPLLWTAWMLTSSALSLHVIGFLLRAYVAGRPPVTNMYESIIWVSFGVQLFAVILYKLQKQKILLPISSFLGTLGMVAADAAPAMLDPGIHPLVPVLRSNYWLTIHVLTITISYSAFALCMGLGNFSLWNFLRQKPGWVARTQNINQLIYRSMQYGVVLLAAGTILGGVWADYSWGRFWGWDPKEVWALIALLIYVAIIHCRYTNWIGQFGFALSTVYAFMGVVMAWYGVNFVLGVGLHSYGFSTGGRGWVAAFVGAQLVYGLIVAAVFRIRNRGGSSGGTPRTIATSPDVAVAPQ